MKRKCKNIDITDIEFIKESIAECFRKKNKNRNDIQRLHEQYKTIDSLATQLQKELLEERLILKPIWYSERIDESSHKLRKIGIQDIKQQIYDYIAVKGLEPLLGSIGRYQCASLKGRGQIYGVKAVSKWLKEEDIRYACKLDIQKCYESINKEKLMEYLRKHIKNNKLLWLIETLINTFASGLAIGSYLSQYLCNLYLSQLYHEISERMYRTRKKRNGTIQRVNLVKHVLFYMDDILILSTNSKDLHKAIKLIHDKITNMDLTIKSNWRAFKLSTNTVFVDMMGFKIYRNHVTIRKYVFLRIYRAIRQATRVMTVRIAQRLISYFGLLKHSNSFKFVTRHKVYELIRKSKKVVANYGKGLFCTGTANGCA